MDTRQGLPARDPGPAARRGQILWYAPNSRRLAAASVSTSKSAAATTVADRVPAWLRCLGQPRSEPLHPVDGGDVVDLDAAFGEQLLDVAEGQAVAPVQVNH
jgi:hypothetical protein